ncbi:uncharacterized protein LOC143455227 [Clavelina lepadiformis]|uniref:uncharacterized protein LOC143455227 n=1 Tax=Clavelina lepadiformis TaxID=159417 RepID=UPI0040431F8C
MSETSFDTSAAETAASMTSGLSLGQCIKQTAEEFSKPSQDWFELNPSTEKEWHTLEGEVSPQMTLLDEMTELPISDTSTCSANAAKENESKVSMNPVSRLLDKTSTKQPDYKEHVRQYLSDDRPNKQMLTKPLSEDLCTPAMTSQRGKFHASNAANSSMNWHFLPPAMKDQNTKDSMLLQMSTTLHSSGISKDSSQQEGYFNDRGISVQNLSNILEKDDSLAQRVQDLLEGDRMNKAQSLQSDASLLSDKVTVRDERSRSYQSDESYKPLPEATLSESDTICESELSEKIQLSDNGISATPKLTTPSMLLKTLNLLGESSFDTSHFTEPQLAAETLDSLNTSKGTEYGDLPDAVDIPHDIVKRLQNMRMIGKESSPTTQPPKSAWMKPSTSQPVLMNKGTTQLSGGVPISGDVQFYTGSNPTTPQLPVEEDKLKQLQSYIEKKTGIPQISPLVVTETATATPDAYVQVNNVDVPTSCKSQKDVSPSPDNPTVSTDNQNVGNVSVNLTFGSPENLTTVPISQMEISEHPLVFSSNSSPSSPKNVDNIERSEPEGMSPPVLNAASASSGQKLALAGDKSKEALDSGLTRANTSSIKDKRVTKHKPLDNLAANQSHFDESLADESLLERIKTVLSDSLSQKQFGSNVAVEQSELSLASSIDSLAVQVKALLEEEMPHMMENNEDLETSNLSEAIEKFENTDLWKFVAQFLPTAADNIKLSSLASSNGSICSRAKSPKTAEEIQNSLKHISSDESTSGLHTVPFNLQRDEEYSAKRQSKTSLNVGSKLLDLSGPAKSYLSQPQNSSKVAKASPHYLNYPSMAATPTGSSLQGVFLPATESNRVSVENNINMQRHTAACRLYANSTSSEKNIVDGYLDPIPGIPDFNPSVLRPPSYETVVSVKAGKSQDLDKDPRTDSYNDDFTDYRTNAKSVIASQLNRAANRNFDVTMTPAKHHASLFPEWKSKKHVEKDQEDCISHNHPACSNKLQKDVYAKTDELRNQSLSQQALCHTSTHSFKSSSEPEHSDATSQPKSYSEPSVTHTEFNKVTSTDVPVYSKSNATQLFKTYKENEATLQPVSGIPLEASVSSRAAEKSAYFHSTSQSGQKTGTRIESSKHIALSLPEMTMSSPRKISPLRERMTVQDWLSSPERKKSSSKQLPTFQELMQNQTKTEIKSKEKVSKQDELDMVPTSDRERSLKPKILNISTTPLQHPSKPAMTKSSYDQINPALLNSKSAAELDQASLQTQVDWSDSYQGASLDMTETQSPRVSSSYKFDKCSSLVNGKSSGTTKSVTEIPKTLKDFESLDDASKHQVLKRILEYFNKSRTKKHQGSQVKSSSSAAPKRDSMKKALSVNDISLNSNQAVCDSDSTEYCDLPSSRPTTAQTNDDTFQRLLGVDESKAEQVMKRLLKKIENQKSSQGGKRKTSTKRAPTSSSTPQKSRPPLRVPEASSIASTDTDGDKQIIRMYERSKHSHKQKIAFVEESSSSDPIIIKVKKRLKKSDMPSAERIYLYDRGIQTVSPRKTKQESGGQDAATNFPSPVRRERTLKKSRAVQTASTQSSTGNDEGEFLNDTITIVENHTEEKENIDSNGQQPKTHRYSSFHINMTPKLKKKPSVKPEKSCVQPGVAWYEPYEYRPAWLQERPVCSEQPGLVRLTLQEALATQNPAFVSKSRERQRRITINSDERRMQEIWEEERQRVFGVKDTKSRRSAPPFVRPKPEITRKEAIAETRKKYQLLPEVIKRKQEEERKREYASHRLKAQLYKKKIQSKVLGKYFCS